MKLEVNHKSSIPLHVQAENLLRKLVAKKEYKDGKLLQGEVELSVQLGISRNTLRHAISKLVNDGILTRKKGVGTKVSRKGVLGRAKNWLSFSQEMKSLGIEIYNFELHVSHIVPDKDVLSFFDLQPNTRVLTLERLRGKKNAPFVYFISYFNPEIGITGNDDFSQPLYEILEEKYNVKAFLSQEEVAAIHAPSFICKKLEIDAHEPVLLRKRLVFDENHNPIEYNLGYYRGDSFVYTVESERKIS
ncbi:MAG: GntR family transcriptional regulator [Niabella sp.]